LSVCSGEHKSRLVSLGEAQNTTRRKFSKLRTRPNFTFTSKSRAFLINTTTPIRQTKII
jgi:hypothetical protein